MGQTMDQMKMINQLRKAQKELKNEICQYGGREAEISMLIFRLLQELSSQQGENSLCLVHKYYPHCLGLNQ